MIWLFSHHTVERRKNANWESKRKMLFGHIFQRYFNNRTSAKYMNSVWLDNVRVCNCSSNAVQNVSWERKEKKKQNKKVVLYFVCGWGHERDRKKEKKLLTIKWCCATNAIKYYVCLQTFISVPMHCKGEKYFLKWNLSWLKTTTNARKNQLII